MGESAGARLFTIEPGRPFALTLARAILAGELSPRPVPPAPGDLPATTVYVPSARAKEALESAFLTASGGRPLLLPRIRLIAADSGDAMLSSYATARSEPLDIAPAVPEIERRLLLMKGVQAWAKQASRGALPYGQLADTPAKAACLAADLARLMDLLESEEVSTDRLDLVVPPKFSENWQVTRAVLGLALDSLPHRLAERGFTSPARHRRCLLDAETDRLSAAPPSEPVIVAGVTAATPAIVRLLRAILACPAGFVVLPGLDLALDEAAWQAVGTSHPEHWQFALKRLLDRLGVERSQVAILRSAPASPAETARVALVSEVMRPAAATARWRQLARTMDAATAGAALRDVSLLEVPSERDEAALAALILRATLEHQGRTAALVTPDRILARRVRTRLAALGIAITDAAGEPLSQTPCGTFLDLASTAVAKDFAPVELVALLHHPFSRLGLPASELGRAAEALELIAFRTPCLGGGLDGIRTAIDRAAAEIASGQRRQRSVKTLPTEDWTRARDLLSRLERAFEPFSRGLRSSPEVPLADLAAAHVAAAEALARLPENEAARDAVSPLWTGEAGETAAALFADLAVGEEGGALTIAGAGYADMVRALMGEERIRPRDTGHPHLSVGGPAEARWHAYDVVVLAGLNEGMWPQHADPGPWLSREMASAIGLPAPEEQTGAAAHDFALLLAAPQVYLTRAERVDGVPTVRSRWLMRLLAVAGALDQKTTLESATPWLAWARAPDRSGPGKRARPPEPRPPLALRPRKLSVSAVETWIANPYAIFASEILKLEPLEPLGAAPGPAVRGAVVHEALARFAKRHPDSLPADIEAALLSLARDVLLDYMGEPRVAVFWLPRFERFAQWFAETEPARRARVARVVAETAGGLVIDAPGGPFTLAARADRIDIGAGGVVITDFKTGAIPRDTAVLAGRAPQLPLEAAIAAEAGFAGMEAGPVSALRFIRASGGEPPGEDHCVNCTHVAALSAGALDGLRHLVACFDDDRTPYRATRRAGFLYTWDAYDHLARAAEWTPEANGEAE